ncbi:gluconokinase [Neokomagataea thailandica NBRC 106555]|uniref:Gluconokinase n=1 Tax=Neokomagataea thailandica NBRC 106555 TaxID=1223520 RepID=A0ABQ0QS72_9PROT|nr:gluconokinase [Neokomagataea thailandica NBRC 106555]
MHPENNIKKMSSGQPLTDEDRRPWLELCHDWLERERNIGHGAVLTCSALKRSYREQLRAGLPVEFVYIKVSPEVLKARMAAREGHFMPPSLLPSQLATLEEPSNDEPVIAVNGEEAAERVVDELVKILGEDAHSFVEVSSGVAPA